MTNGAEMKKRHKNRLKHDVTKPVGQCRDCTVKYCPDSKQQSCAKADFMAIAAETSYECPDRVAPYWETMCA